MTPDTPTPQRRSSASRQKVVLTDLIDAIGAGRLARLAGVPPRALTNAVYDVKHGRANGGARLWDQVQQLYDAAGRHVDEIRAIRRAIRRLIRQQENDAGNDGGVTIRSRAQRAAARATR